VDADYLMKLAQEIVDLRWQNYENMARWQATDFQPIA
jgi:pyruvate-ferredoxin/flavodoxin oxidoreductase